MIYTLFFSRLRDMSEAERREYADHAAIVRSVAATTHPGFVSQKTYVAEDGERLTVVAFRDAEAQRSWRLDPEHREAQAKGRSDYYEQYRIVICDEVRARDWVRLESEAEQ